MLTTFNEIKGQPIHASDGEIGSIHDVLFEGDCGAVRYFVVDTGGWLFGRKVLVSVYGIRAGDTPGMFSVDVTREAIKDGPDVDSEKPLKRDVLTAYHDYYSWPYYWVEGGLRDGPLGVSEPVAKLSAAPLPADSLSPPPLTDWGDVEPLSGARKVIGFDLMSHDEVAADGGDKIGKVDELIFDTDGWLVRFLVIDRGHQDMTIVPARWIESIDWDSDKLQLLVPDALVAAGPSYGGMPNLVSDNGEELERYFDSVGPDGLTRDTVNTGTNHHEPLKARAQDREPTRSTR
jgi:uncharacterized protein YrrD